MLEGWVSGWAGRQLPGRGTVRQALRACCARGHPESCMAVCRRRGGFLAHPVVFAHHSRQWSVRPEFSFQRILDTFGCRPLTCFIKGSSPGCGEPALSWGLLTQGVQVVRS